MTETMIPVVTCAACQLVSVNTAQTRCPVCQAVLGETVLTAAEIEARCAPLVRRMFAGHGVQVGAEARELAAHDAHVAAIGGRCSHGGHDWEGTCSDIDDALAAARWTEPIPDTTFYRPMRAGHVARTGHELAGQLVSDDGAMWQLERTCCG
jgi:hypothetical protein